MWWSLNFHDGDKAIVADGEIGVVRHGQSIQRVHQAS
jgi:hypothetical protein